METRQVVWLLTASTSYLFGAVQKSLCGIRFRFVCFIAASLTTLAETLQRVFPHIIRDVFEVGHCMYGCQSCGIHEHNLPLKFTRFVRGDLPYQARDVRALFSEGRTVLLCPSIHVLSMMARPDICMQLVDIQKRLNLNMVVKLHSNCYAYAC